MARNDPIYRVVLNEPDSQYATATATVYTFDLARKVARSYLEAVPRGRVRVWTPPDSRDSADHEWTLPMLDALDLLDG